MSMSTSLHAFTAEITALERAKDAAVGIRVKFTASSAARTYVARLHQARTLDRRRNALIFPVGDNMHGCSEFDIIKVTHYAENGVFWVELKKNNILPTNIEELT